MNLKHLDSVRLVSHLKSLVGDERRITTQILHHLREVEARRLFEPCYPSLFDFCVRELGYSNDAAYRRISAMRALKELGKSTRQAEVLLSAQASVPVETRTVKVELSNEDYEKLLKLQALFSHRRGGDTHSGVISLLLDDGLDRHDPARREVRRKSSLRAPEVENKVEEGNKADPHAPSVSPICSGATEGLEHSHSRYIPVAGRLVVQLVQVRAAALTLLVGS